MQAAPATSLVCDDGGGWRAVCAVLNGLALAVLLQWALQWGWPGQVRPGAATAIVATSALAGLALVAWQLRRARPTPGLAWDGRQWHWLARGAASQACRVDVVLDLGGWMLLAVQPLGHDGRPGPRRCWPVGALMAAPARAALYAGSHQDPQRPASGRAV